jgi:hypothetical protein
VRLKIFARGALAQHAMAAGTTFEIDLFAWSFSAAVISGATLAVS